MERALGGMFSLQDGRKIWRLQNGRIFGVREPEAFATLSQDQKLDETAILQNQQLCIPAKEHLKQSDVDYILNTLRSAYECLPININEE